MTKEGHTQSVNFMTPGAGVLMIGHGHTRLTLKMHYKSILYSQTWIRQTKCIVITTRKDPPKLYILRPQEGIIELERGHVNHIVNMHYLLLHQYIAHRS